MSVPSYIRRTKMLHILMNIVPDPPTGTPAEVFKDNIDFFAKWIGRIGSMIAFVGAVKLAVSIKSDDAKEQFTALMTMVAGFMIAVAVKDMSIFNIPKTYSEQAANNEFSAIVRFIGKWTRRAGAAVMLFGGASLMYSIKDDNAGAKALATRTITAGATIAAISASIGIFL